MEEARSPLFNTAHSLGGGDSSGPRPPSMLRGMADIFSSFTCLINSVLYQISCFNSELSDCSHFRNDTFHKVNCIEERPIFSYGESDF